MKGLVLHARVDTSQDQEDYLDEKYFRLLARRFKKANSDYDIRIEQFDEDDSAEFLADMSKPEYRNLDVFVYIGHGGRHSLGSANVGGTSGASQMATRLTAACNDNATIIFYACNTGKLGNSVLRNIHNLTTSKSFRLYGHSTVGRAGNNPNKTVFPPVNGEMLIDRCLGNLARAPKFRRA